MTCYHPLEGWRARVVGSNGKRPIVFKRELGFSDLPVKVPCGRCIGCRLDRSREWAIRCMHEASLHVENSFVTLTYDDEHLPESGSLDVRHFQLFIKKLRARVYEERGIRFRFYHCGEYGEQYGRPHYHACLFGLDFPDKRLWKVERGNRLYKSSFLEEVWSNGHCIIGEVTFNSAAYVARYITKKITGEKAAEWYEYIDPNTGEIHELKPEYTTMSRRPGIGHGWFKDFKSDVYPGDFVVVNGKKMKPPKYYDRQYEVVCPSDYAKMKAKRVINAKVHEANSTPERLKVREKIQKARYKMLKRGMEEES